MFGEPRNPVEKEICELEKDFLELGQKLAKLREDLPPEEVTDYKLINIDIPRDASQQVKVGDTLLFVDEAKPGDLAFFGNDEGVITHVGMIWKHHKIIHASGRVRIDNIDQEGIFNEEMRRYTHKLRTIKRILR